MGQIIINKYVEEINILRARAHGLRKDRADELEYIKLHKEINKLLGELERWCMMCHRKFPSERLYRSGV